MNNDSTFVPGMEKNAQGIVNPYSAASAREINGTYVPGMQNVAPASVEEPTRKPTEPVVGFLYSISHGGMTEYWPIHLGANIIGRGEGVDICLNEATVSGRHAQINVRQLKKSHKLIASIQDIGSKCGMFLNDTEMEYDALPCKNGDVVTVGEAYKLIILLVDVDALGLAPAENFMAVEQKEEEAVPPVPSLPDFGGYDPYNRNNSGTVDLNGGAPISAPGGTLIIE